MGLQMMKRVQGGFLFCDRWSLLEKNPQEDLYICINYTAQQFYAKKQQTSHVFMHSFGRTLGAHVQNE